MGSRSNKILDLILTIKRFSKLPRCGENLHSFFKSLPLCGKILGYLVIELYWEEWSGRYCC